MAHVASRPKTSGPTLRTWGRWPDGQATRWSDEARQDLVVRVIRVTNPETGLSKPKWVGGFADEDAAKEARDEARRASRRGEYVDRSTIKVSEYLCDWLDPHTLEVKSKTLAGYRDLIGRYVDPRIGDMKLQAVRPTTLSAMYRNMLANGGRGGNPLSRRTVNYVHAILRKAFNDQALVGEAWTDTGHVFTTGLGRPIFPDTVSQLMPKLIAAYNDSDPEDASKRPAKPLPHARLCWRPGSCGRRAARARRPRRSRYGSTPT